jgi:hypothetical protein
MASMNPGDSLTMRVNPGETLSLVLASGATVTLIERGTDNKPLTPSSVTLTPSLIGPFSTAKIFEVQANGAVVTATVGPAIIQSQSSNVLQQSGVAIVSANSASEQSMVSVPVPAGAMGLNGSLRIWTLWSMVNNANAKTHRIRLNGIAGTIIQSLTAASLVQFSACCRVTNRGALNSQVAGEAGINLIGSSANALVTAAIDTSLAWTVDITTQKATGTDAVSLEAYCVELCSDFN